ncbi:MAG: CRISPR-associated protein Cas4 [Candidatus Fermentibacter sp.]|nr:CRISPR-associated protein Cas4 [Candidatus Fermentibacter sp.]
MTRLYSDDELLALSLLQHIMFCERQCSLNSNEQLWFDNKLTVSGSQLHRRVHGDAPRREKRGDVIVVRELLLCSHSLGVTGKADVVEFHRVSINGISMEGCDGLWQPFPVEYKHGKPKVDDCDRVQLCAQAICLEEMLGAEVPEGAIFYGRIQKREAVVFDPVMRRTTCDSASKLHALVEGGRNPPAVFRDGCTHCAMKDACMPEVTGLREKASGYIVRALSGNDADG